MNWYLSHEGQTFGPFDEEQAKQEARKYPQGMAWKEGFTGWVPIGSLAELNQGGGPPDPGQVAPPPPPSDLRTMTKSCFRMYGGFTFQALPLPVNGRYATNANSMML